MRQAEAILLGVAILAGVLGASVGQSAGGYVLSDQGQSCATACGALGRECDPHVATNNSSAIFQSLGVSCQPNPQPYWAADQPNFVTGKGDPNFGECLGYINTPATIDCQAIYWSVRRLCKCGNDITAQNFFGTGYSGGFVSSNETTRFAHVVEDGSYGVMTHFWTTGPPVVLANNVTFRYYIDGETTASIAFRSGLAVGVGFDDEQAPWGTKWFGVGAGSGNGGAAYFLNFQIPFQKSIRITTQADPGVHVDGFYMIVRGAKNKKIEIGGYSLPSNAKLWLQSVQTTLQPLDFLRVTDVPSGQGMHFMSTLAVVSGNLNFLEGCYHAYDPYNQTFPGTLLSTGTEDYFDSGWYFNAGEFHLPVSGFTHLNTSKGVAWSAYRFHEMDPLLFNNGFRFEWRNGDMVDPYSGLKCFTLANGPIAGSPTASQVISYSWVYTW